MCFVVFSLFILWIYHKLHLSHDSQWITVEGLRIMLLMFILPEQKFHVTTHICKWTWDFPNSQTLFNRFLFLFCSPEYGDFILRVITQVYTQSTPTSVIPAEEGANPNFVHSVKLILGWAYNFFYHAISGGLQQV